MGWRNCHQHFKDWGRDEIYINETRVMLAFVREREVIRKDLMSLVANKRSVLV